MDLARELPRYKNDLLEALHRILGPFGVKVKVEILDTWGSKFNRGPMRTTLELDVRCGNHFFKGERVYQQFVLDEREILYRRELIRAEDYAEQLARQWFDSMMKMFQKTTRAIPDSPDWRPAEMIPEDFYAM